MENMQQPQKESQPEPEQSPEGLRQRALELLDTRQEQLHRQVETLLQQHKDRLETLRSQLLSQSPVGEAQEDSVRQAPHQDMPISTLLQWEKNQPPSN